MRFAARTTTVFFSAILALGLFSGSAHAARNDRRQVGLPIFTIESEHFRIHYDNGTEPIARRVAGMLEELYAQYTKDYRIVLPRKTDVLVSSTGDNENSFASANTNLISVAPNDFGFDWFLRGSGNYLRDVVAHEFAHIVSISSAMKAPEWLLGLQAGYFTHPNDFNGDVGEQVAAMHIYPFENLPPWFSEGIAQYESTRMGGDRWDTHRDMILRTLTISNKLLSWDHMSVFAGRGDDYEKTYNHGFSLVSYIAETYGHDAIVSMLHESGRLLRINFDRGVKRTLGIPARKLHRDWTAWLQKRYNAQLQSIGPQVYGKKISQYGFENRWPRFAPNDSAVLFLSNWKNDYSWRKIGMYRYGLFDTTDEDKRTKRVKSGAASFYDIHDSLGLIVYPTVMSPRSALPFNQGGERVRDLTFDTLVNPPPKGEREAKPSRDFRKARKHPITRRASLFAAAFSPSGNRLAALKHVYDRFYLCVLDTNAGAKERIVYPPKNDTTAAIQTIYSLDWSPDGHSIVLSYVQHWGDRKIGIYDTLDGTFKTIADTEFDERDPRFSPDGKRVYFASDRSGIFNIYRYDLENETTEKITNVSGGAFMPDISRDERRLAYVNYDTAGYSVYLLDSISALTQDSVLFQPFSPAPRTAEAKTPVSRPERYSRLPRQFMMVPTIFGEQTTTDPDQPFKGEGVVKAGAVFYLMDPRAWIRGNDLGAYFLLEPSKLFSFLDSKYIINPDVNYDFGIFGSTRNFPVQLDAEYFQRGIAGRDIINTADSAQAIHVRYSIVPHVFALWAGKSFSDFSNIPISLHAVASYNSIGVRLFWSLDDGPEYTSNYTYAKGFRLGTYVTAVNRKTDRYYWIAPRGAAFKLAYDFNEQLLQTSNESISGEDFKVSDDYYDYHQVSGTFKWGLKMPWSRRQRLYADIFATAVQLTNSTEERLVARGRSPTLTSFYEPIAIVPGYAYYYRDTLPKASQTAGDSIADTVLVSGNAVATIGLSYRFPLWPRSIDKKLGFLYFDHIYGAVNAHAGAGWNRVSDIFDMRRSDWLTSIGAEIRLEAISFNRYPFMVSVRWDRGLDKPAPIGGDRFTFTLGFAFEDWGILERPDYYAAPVDKRSSRLPVR